MTFPNLVKNKFNELVLDSKYYSFQLAIIPTLVQLDNIKLLIDSKDYANLSLAYQAIKAFYKPIDIYYESEK